MVLEAGPLILAKQQGASFSQRDRMSGVLLPNKNIPPQTSPLQRPKMCESGRGGEEGMEAQGGFRPSVYPSFPHDPAHLTSLLQ